MVLANAVSARQEGNMGSILSAVLWPGRRALTLAGLVVSICGVSAGASAQGYSLYQLGACEMGRAGAGVAAPCDDGSGMFFNPAGITTAQTTLTIGATAVPPRGDFTNDLSGRVSTLNTSTTLVPTIYFAQPISQRFTIGVGMFSPYGLASDWPTTSEGRFLGYYSSVKSLYIQPTIAVRLSDWIQVGAGIDITRVSVELKNRLDLSAMPIAPAVTFQALGVPKDTDFADLDLTGNAFSVGAHLGIIVKATDAISFGARYLMRQTSNINNGQLATNQLTTGLSLKAPMPGIPAGTPLDAMVAPMFKTGRMLGTQNATTSMPLPDQVVAGIAFRPANRWLLLADYQFTNWSLFNTLDIHNQFAPETTMTQNYVNTHGIRTGAEYTIRPSLTVRGGFDAYTAGAPDASVTPIIPDAPRREYSAGATLKLSRRTAIDAAYQYIDQQDRRGGTSDAGTGIYHINANIFSVSWRIGF
jgi:long-chain fatty acid transport protein